MTQLRLAPALLRITVMFALLRTRCLSCWAAAPLRMRGVRIRGASAYGMTHGAYVPQHEVKW